MRIVLYWCGVLMTVIRRPVNSVIIITVRCGVVRLRTPVAYSVTRVSCRGTNELFVTSLHKLLLRLNVRNDRLFVSVFIEGLLVIQLTYMLIV